MTNNKYHIKFYETKIIDKENERVRERERDGELGYKNSNPTRARERKDSYPRHANKAGPTSPVQTFDGHINFLFSLSVGKNKMKTDKRKNREQNKSITGKKGNVISFPPFHHLRDLFSSSPGTNLGRVNNVLTRETPSRADQSFPGSEFISSSASSFPPFGSMYWQVRTVPERFRLVGQGRYSSFSVVQLTSSAEESCSLDLVFAATDMLSASESRKRQTTAQSSTLDVGYLCLQDRTAVSTNARAAEDLAGAVATMSTTSLFESTSQIYHEKN